MDVDWDSVAIKDKKHLNVRSFSVPVHTLRPFVIGVYRDNSRPTAMIMTHIFRIIDVYKSTSKLLLSHQLPGLKPKNS